MSNYTQAPRTYKQLSARGPTSDSSTNESPTLRQNTQQNLHQYQKTPTDLFLNLNRSFDINLQPNVRKPISALPQSQKTTVSSSLNLRTHCSKECSDQKFERVCTSGETPERARNTHDIASERLSTHATEYTNEPEQLDKDNLFENFDKYFKIKLPSGNKSAVITNTDISARKIKKTLVFGGSSEESPVICPESRIQRNSSRQNLNNIKPSVLPSLNRLLNDYTTESSEAQYAHAKLSYQPVVGNHTRNGSITNNYKYLSTIEGREFDLAGKKFINISQRRRNPIVPNPVVPLPRLENQENKRNLSIHNDTLVTNMDLNHYYEREPVSSGSRNNDYIKDNWRIFDRTRERLSTVNHTINSNIPSVNATINNSNRTYITNEIYDKDRSTEMYNRPNIDRRRSSRYSMAGERLNEKLITMRNDFENKENYHPAARPISSKRTHIDRYSQVYKSANEIEAGFAECARNDTKPSANSTQQGLRAVVNNEQSNRAYQHRPYVLKDITNQIEQIREEIPTMKREYKARPEKLTNDNNYVPKPVQEILRNSRQCYDSRRTSQIGFPLAQQQQRSTSVPRRYYHSILYPYLISYFRMY